MTDRERRARLKIATAERAIVDARARLKSSLINGENTSTLRREIESLAERADTARAELADMLTTADVARGQRLSELSATIAGEAGARIEAATAKLRPPAKTEFKIKESNHDHA